MGVERSGGGAIGEKGHPLCMRDRKKMWLVALAWMHAIEKGIDGI